MTQIAAKFKRNLTRSRIMLYAIVLPMLAFSLDPLLWLTSAWRLIYVIIGFSLIIFLHELGHFLVARACSVKCLAFSLGIGPRAFGWRKGGRFTFGPDPYDPEVKARKKPSKHDKVEHVEAATTHSDLPTTATPPHHPAGVGDCDYRISWLPLGGYVRMLGQDDMDPTKVSDDPRAFNNRPIWQRMCIVSAGVTMNVIFAAVAFSIIFSPNVGVDFPPAVVGQVVVDSPADKAGLQMGDVVTAIDGKTPRGKFVEFTDVSIKMALSQKDEPHKLDWDHTNPDGTVTHQSQTLVPVVLEGGNGFLAAGIEQMPSLHIIRTQDGLNDFIEQKEKPGKGEDADPAAAAEFKKLQPRDNVVAINGQSLEGLADNQAYPRLYQVVQKIAPNPVTVTVRNPKGGGDRTLTLIPKLEMKLGVKDYPDFFGMRAAEMVREVDSSAPAFKQLKKGDIILAVGDRAYPNFEEFQSVVKPLGGSQVAIRVLRDGQTLNFTIAITGKPGHGLMGVGLSPAKDKLIVVPGGMASDQAAATRANDANLPDLFKNRPCLTIVRVDGKTVAKFDEVLGILRSKHPGDTVEIAFEAPAADTQPADSQPSTQAAQTFTQKFTIDQDLAAALIKRTHFLLNLPVEFITRRQNADDAWGATMMGMEHTEKFILQVYMTLRGLFIGTVDPSNLHGIVGITKVGYEVQDRGPGWLWYVLAMVSVNLAVANFLPLPIVDGGLFLLLILEKIRGKPLSLKVQSAIQVVGIVLLAGLFLFVTWNDISLFIPHK